MLLLQLCPLIFCKSVAHIFRKLSKICFFYPIFNIFICMFMLCIHMIATDNSLRLSIHILAGSIKEIFSIFHASLCFQLPRHTYIKTGFLVYTWFQFIPKLFSIEHILGGVMQCMECWWVCTVIHFWLCLSFICNFRS